MFATNGRNDVPSSGKYLLKFMKFSGKEIFLRKGSVVALATEVQSVMIVKKTKRNLSNKNLSFAGKV